jgi:hypothetical protein
MSDGSYILLSVSTRTAQPLKADDLCDIIVKMTDDPEAISSMLYTTMCNQFQKGNTVLSSVIVGASEAFLAKFPEVREELKADEN